MAGFVPESRIAKDVASRAESQRRHGVGNVESAVFQLRARKEPAGGEVWK